MGWADDVEEYGLDRDTDEGLGDEFELAADGVTFATVFGFAFPPGSEADIGYAPVDNMSGQPRIKIAKSIVPVPKMAMRFRIPQLGDSTTLWRPENWVTIDAGRRWLIDMQKAST